MAPLLVLLLASCVPARWNSTDVQTIPLLQETPINCVLMEEWTEEFVTAARSSGIHVLAVTHTPQEAEAVSGVDGIVVEGDFQAPGAVVELRSRAGFRLDTEAGVVGSYEGVWPGISTIEDGSAKAAPTGAPWIDTNSGFVRFVRAATDKAVWMANRPPAGEVFPVARYLQAVGDAAMVGARWVVSLDQDFERRLLAGEEAARDDWRRIGDHVRWWEDHREWADFRPYRGLAVIQDESSRPTLSGGIIDMIAARHTPLRSVPTTLVGEETIAGAIMAVNVDPSAVPPERKPALLGFTRRGGTLLNGPPGWTFPPLHPGQVVMEEDQVKRLEAIWQGVNSMVGRENLGVRLFNVSTMRSELTAGPGGRPVVLHLLNYSDYPVENVTVHFLERLARARLYAPGREPRDLEVYEQDNGSGVDIDRVETSATLAID